MANHVRKPVAMVVDHAGCCLVVCDDGASFVMLSSVAAALGDSEPGMWIERAPIPGSARHYDLNRAHEEGGRS
jgi:hypothetical protein